MFRSDRFYNFLNLFGKLYTFCLVVWFAIWRLLGDVNGWIALVNAWAFWLLAIGIPVGAATLVRRSYWLAILWISAIGGFLLQFYQRQLRGFLAQAGARPQSHSATAEKTSEPRHQLILYSANLLNYPRPLDQAIEQVLASQADVIFFQESIKRHLPQLKQALAEYPFQCWIPYFKTNLGLGVVSRIPFAVTGFWQNVGLEPYALRITVKLTGGPVDLYCVHCISPAHQIRTWGPTLLLHTREQQVLNLLATVESRDYPAILAGDWNATEAADSYRWISERLVDGWLEADGGFGWSWPHFWDKPGRYPARPLLRLDYLFHTGKSRSRTVKVESMQCITVKTTSDHCPIVARLSISET